MRSVAARCLKGEAPPRAGRSPRAAAALGAVREGRPPLRSYHMDWGVVLSWSKPRAALK